ncbi:MAG TPA: 16S rRNA (guanine(527)-N(7))-methyltransferase RsmG [Bacteroidota bacterium]
MEDPLLWLRTVCAKGGLRITDAQLDLLRRYVELLLEWNTKINLISRKDTDKVWKSHILHCLSILFKVHLADGIRMLDLGSGGGLPGIPLKIVVPSIDLLMVDATQKKTKVVSEMIVELGLSNAAVQWGRAEELSKEKKLRGKFDIIVARGVGPLNELVALAHPFAAKGPGRSGGRTDPILLEPPCLLAYKGGDLTDELAKVRRDRRVHAVEVLPLAAEGIDPAEEKKLVIVQL